MTVNKKYSPNRYLILGVIVLYFFVAVVHIFFLSPVNLAANQSAKTFSRRKIEIAHSVNFIERAAKATVKERANLQLADVFFSHSENFQFNYLPKSNTFVNNCFQNRSCLNFRRSYLNFCTFRI